MRLTRFALALACSAALTLPALAQTTTTPTPAAPTTPAPATPAQVAPARPRTAATPATPQPMTGMGTTAPSATTPSTTTAGAATAEMVNINTATATDLDKLPQIGKARAAAIIKGRPYKSTDELVSKKVLSKGVYNRIKDRITT